MPSWNIHTGLVERLASGNDLASLGIRDLNAYHFGNLVPDVYVGYMVPDVSHTLLYTDTHHTLPSHIPVADHQEFWDRWVEPFVETGGVDDVTLGAWAHLLADHHYNERVNAFLAEHNVPSGEQTRIRKQGDFDRFGHGLGITLTVDPNERLKAQAARFPEYQIEGADVEAACRAHAKLVEASREVPDGAGYSLLSEELIGDVFDRIDRDTRERLSGYAAAVRAAGHDPMASPPERPLDRPSLRVGPEPTVLLAQDWQAAAAAAQLAG